MAGGSCCLIVGLRYFAQAKAAFRRVSLFDFGGHRKHAERPTTLSALGNRSAKYSSDTVTDDGTSSALRFSVAVGIHFRTAFDGQALVFNIARNARARMQRHVAAADRAFEGSFDSYAVSA